MKTRKESVSLYSPEYDLLRSNKKVEFEADDARHVRNFISAVQTKFGAGNTSVKREYKVIVRLISE